ncbi:MAG: glycosyltransferase family 2 protein [Flavobacteriaceae bacterium]|nr:glycosyltransferase family 2 protein [Flavobacteriaceae bacterium]
MNIAVVILNWNGKGLLQQFLPSVIEFSPEAQIILADNASTDDSINYVETHFPHVRIIRNRTNGGFAKGYNDALKHVDADIICLLNNDVEVTQNWLDPIISRFSQESDTAIIQPKICDLKNKDHFEYAGAGGGFIDKYGFPYCRGRLFETLEKDQGQYDDFTEIFWASGACLFIRKNTFDQLEGFDESFFAHMEEIDLCWRVFNSGGRIKYEGQSVIYHLGGATLSNTNPKKTYLNFKNSLFMLVKNLPSGKVFPVLFIRLMLDGLASLKFLLDGMPLHFLAVLRSHITFFLNLPKLIRTRKGHTNRNNYYHRTSIVWSYFVNKKRTFDSL